MDPRLGGDGPRNAIRRRPAPALPRSLTDPRGGSVPALPPLTPHRSPDFLDAVRPVSGLRAYEVGRHFTHARKTTPPEIEDHLGQEEDQRKPPLAPSPERHQPEDVRGDRFPLGRPCRQAIHPFPGARFPSPCFCPPLDSVTSSTSKVVAWGLNMRTLARSPWAPKSLVNGDELPLTGPSHDLGFVTEARIGFISLVQTKFKVRALRGADLGRRGVGAGSA
jgi:hypothetical protein